VATPIALIADPDEELAEPAKADAPAARRPGEDRDQGGDAGRQATLWPPSARSPHRASPKARRMACEHGVELSGLTGSGPGGRIVGADVDAAMVRPAIPDRSAGPERTGAPSRVRQVVADRLTASYRQAPHIHLSADIDASWMALVRRGMADQGQRVTYTDLIVRAAALALIQVPDLNGLYEDGQLRRVDTVDVGIATLTPQGLLVPVLRRASELGLAEVAAESARLVQGARAGSLGPDEYAGGSFTVTNLGMYGVRAFTAILNPPQVGILAVGAVEDRVVPVGEGRDAAPTLGIRPALSVTLGLDHRALDGVAGALFLQNLRRHLESPGLLG